MRADVLLVALVQGQVILLQVMSLLLVLVKVFVVEVGLEEVLLFSLFHPQPKNNSIYSPRRALFGPGSLRIRLPVCGPCTRQALFWTSWRGLAALRWLPHSLGPAGSLLQGLRGREYGTVLSVNPGIWQPACLSRARPPAPLGVQAGRSPNAGRACGEKAFPRDELSRRAGCPTPGRSERGEDGDQP